jgi:hypothetical protein
MTENEELCLLVGFTCVNLQDNIRLWTKPGDKAYSIVQTDTDNGSFPDLFHDLNALDKWVFQAVKAKGGYWDIWERTFDKDWSITIVDIHDHIKAGVFEKDLKAGMASAALKFLRER